MMPPSHHHQSNNDGDDDSCSNLMNGSRCRSSVTTNNRQTVLNKPAETVVIPRSSPPRTAATTTASNVQHQYRPPTEDSHRAVHLIRLSALQHNYACVESAANRQKCSVIVVVKADGYGHSAIATALHLADHCGADAFAVATLEEAIALRKGFEQNPAGRWSKHLASFFHHGAFQNTPFGSAIDAMAANSNFSSHNNLTLAPPVVIYNNNNNHNNGNSSTVSPITMNGNTTMANNSKDAIASARVMRPAQIRILVLGPPVGFPRCFNEYYHYNIEVMISGPEVAAALMAWVGNETERKRLQVERAAMEAKEQAMLLQPKPALWSQAVAPQTTAPTAAVATQAAAIAPPPPPPPTACNSNIEDKQDGTAVTVTTAGTTSGAPTPLETESPTTAQQRKKNLPYVASTLGNVSGQDLAKELRTLLLNQQTQKEAWQYEQQNNQKQQQHSAVTSASQSQRPSEVSSVASSETGSQCSGGGGAEHIQPNQQVRVQAPVEAKRHGQVFGGIEAMARTSRYREQATASANRVFLEDSSDSDNEDIKANTNINAQQNSHVPAFVQPNAIPATRKRLRWHALVDSGMGRLGFKTDPVHKNENRRDTVDILQELVNAEIMHNAPIEFYGMCTHMADASNEVSNFTQSQIGKFNALLRRVRAAGISVPTVSTDNSAALLSTNLTHFDPNEILTQPGINTRGYVRTGGAIYGQRPAFTQLKPASTLIASVRHVAILKKGDSVGYDRAYVAPYKVRIATLTIGFADGYPRELGNGVGQVAIRGSIFPVAGNVCMDMLMVELGPAEDTECVGATVVVGDTAVLWGPIDDDEHADDEGLVRLQDLAAKLKTTQSALTCGLDKMRVTRHFV